MLEYEMKIGIAVLFNAIYASVISTSAHPPPPGLTFGLTPGISIF